LFEWIATECESVFDPTDIHRMNGDCIRYPGILQTH